MLPFNPNVNSTVYVPGPLGLHAVRRRRLHRSNGSTTRQYAAAFDTAQATANVTDFNPALNSQVQTLAITGSTLYIGGHFTTVNGTVTRNRLAAFDTSQATNNVLPFNPNMNGAVYALALPTSGSTLYAGGGFTQVNGSTTRQYAAAFDTTQATANVTDFNPALNSQVQTIALSGSTLYVGGYFTSFAGNVTRNRMAAFDVDAPTTAPTEFDPRMGAQVNAIAVAGGAVYAGGAFTIANMTPRNNIARINTATNTLSDFDPNVNSAVNALLLSGGTLYAGGFSPRSTGTCRAAAWPASTSPSRSTASRASTRT